jgi:hypothetical protein
LADDNNMAGMKDMTRAMKRERGNIMLERVKEDIHQDTPKDVRTRDTR